MTKIVEENQNASICQTQLNSKMGKPYFLKKPQPQNHKPQNHTTKPSVTFSQLLPNLTCNQTFLLSRVCV